MSFCSKCGSELIKGDRFCPGCGIKVETKEEEVKRIEEKVNNVCNHANNGFTAIFVLPFVIAGVAFLIMAIIGFFLKLYTPVYAFVGLIWGIIIGAIFCKIGQFISKGINPKKTRDNVIVIGIILGIIIGIWQVPHYLNYVNMYY